MKRLSGVEWRVLSWWIVFCARVVGWLCRYVVNKKVCRKFKIFLTKLISSAKSFVWIRGFFVIRSGVKVCIRKFYVFFRVGSFLILYFVVHAQRSITRIYIHSPTWRESRLHSCAFFQFVYAPNLSIYAKKVAKKCSKCKYRFVIPDVWVRDCDVWHAYWAVFGRVFPETVSV